MPGGCVALKLYELWLLAGPDGGGLALSLDDAEPDIEALSFARLGDCGGSSARPFGNLVFEVIFCAAKLAGAIIYLPGRRRSRRW